MTKEKHVLDPKVNLFKHVFARDQFFVKNTCLDPKVNMFKHVFARDHFFVTKHMLFGAAAGYVRCWGSSF